MGDRVAMEALAVGLVVVVVVVGVVPRPKHSIEMRFVAEGEEGEYEVRLECKVDGQPLFRSTGHFTSLLEVIDDARFHADATIGLLRDKMMPY